MRRIVFTFTCLVSLAALAATAYAAYTISQAEPRVANVSSDIARCQDGYTAASASITAITNTLTAIPTTYGQLLTDVAAAAKAQPDSSWPALQKRIVDLTAEFTALTPKVTTAKNCFAAIEAKGWAKVQAALDGIQ